MHRVNPARYNEYVTLDLGTEDADIFVGHLMIFCNRKIFRKKAWTVKS
jgi:hypothetical protein